MKRFKFMFIGKCALLLFGLGIISCASIPRLTVTYGLPSKSAQFGNKAVFLSVRDDQPNREILGMGARRDFEGSPVSLALAIQRDGEEPQGVGVFELPMLLKESFRRRIEQAGLEISDSPRGVPEISIVLKDFFLDLVDRKWRFTMSFEARCISEGKILAHQTINGNGERLKLYGHKQADEVLGEVFSDTVNQFDPERLLRQAGF